MDEAGAGFQQAGVAACRWLLGCGKPEAGERFEILVDDVCGGYDWRGDGWYWQVTAQAAGFEEGPFELKADLNWFAGEESEAGAELWGAGAGRLILTAVGRPVRHSLLLWALKSWFRCSSTTSCADSWSCTYITWAPTPKLMVRGARPHRKSLICQEWNINKS